jgi:hypothetical protein
VRSQPITITVGESRQSQGDTPDLFLETEVSPQSPYVQSQLTYTVRVFHAVALQSGQLSEPASDGALILKIGEDRTFAATRNGRRYRVIERKYAVFPQQSGEVTLEAPVLEGQVIERRRNGNRQFGGAFFNGFIDRARPVRVRGEPRTVQVRPRPPAARDHGQWLPAQSVELSGEWDPRQEQMNVGEPVTLTVKLSASGLAGTQLADVAPKQIDGFSIYPDNADAQTTFSAQGIAQGSLTQKIAFIPRRAGELTIPDLVVRWWNTKTDREEVAVLPGITRSVLGAVPAQPAVNATAPRVMPAESPSQVPDNVSPAPGMADENHLWMGVSALFALAWLITLALWRRDSHSPVTKQDSGESGSTASSAAARSKVLQACRHGDAHALRKALLVWGTTHWPEDPPTGLDQIAARIADAPLAEGLRALDRALYGDATQWQPTVLEPLLSALPTAQGTTSSTSSRSALPLHYAQSGAR